ncbi:hypothetical protein C0995_007151, partial [Termitomyces sp. Mi166
MHFSTSFSVTVALVLSAFAGSNSLTNDVKSPGEPKGEYIITFKSNNRPSCITHNPNVIYHYTIINGVAGRFTDDEIQELQASSDVEGVYQDHDGIVIANTHTDDQSPPINTNTQHRLTLVDVHSGGLHLVDTMIEMIMVMELIAHRRYKPLDRAVFNLTKNKIPVIVAAGNYAREARGFSPAGVQGTITVAASNIADEETTWSNHGDAVDIFAGGEDIVSAATNSTNVSLISSIVAMFLTTGKHTPSELKKLLNDSALH